MKASSTLTIVVLVLIVVVAVMVLPNLGLTFSGSGGNVPISNIEYSNDVITVEDFSISDRSPFSGTSIAMSFSVKNNGDNDFDESNDLTVTFTDLPNIDGIKLKCPDYVTFVSDDFSCKIKNLESADSKMVQAEFAVKSGITDEIKTSTIKYSVSYNLDGVIEAKIPVVESPTFLPNDARFEASAPTYGPIQVSIRPPVGKERIENGRTITDNFAYTNLPFSLELSVNDIGSLNHEQVKFEKANLDSGREKFQISLENLEVILCDKTTKKISDGTQTLITTPEQKIPFDIKCNMKPTGSENYYIGDVVIRYAYDYRLLGSETLTIRPFKTAN